MLHWTGSALVHVMAWPLFGAKPLPELMLAYCQLDSWEQISVKFELQFYHFHSRKCIWNSHLPLLCLQMPWYPGPRPSAGLSWKCILSFSCNKWHQSKWPIKSNKIYCGIVMPCGTRDLGHHGASMGPIWGRQDPGGPHVGPINFAIWDWFR